MDAMRLSELEDRQLQGAGQPGVAVDGADGLQAQRGGGVVAESRRSPGDQVNSPLVRFSAAQMAARWDEAGWAGR